MYTNKPTMSLHTGYRILPLLLLLGPSAAFSGNPVQSVQLTVESSGPHALPHIVVANDGTRYTRLQTSTLAVPLRFSASCSADTTLRQAYLGVGRFNLLSGKMDEDQKIYFERLQGSLKSNRLRWRRHVFNFDVGRIPFKNTNPVSACNSFLQQKLSQGLSRQVFMQQPRKMKMVFEISFAAECKRKWKHVGMWKQVTRKVAAVVVCKGRH